MMKRIWNSEKGFTLMELIIVIVILGILALIAIPRLLGFTDQARLANDKEYAAVAARAAELHWATNYSTTTSSVTYDLSDASGELSTLVDDSDEKLQWVTATGSSEAVVSTGGTAVVTLGTSAGRSIIFLSDPGTGDAYTVTE